jgi:hypothetical protein
MARMSSYAPISIFQVLQTRGEESALMTGGDELLNFTKLDPGCGEELANYQLREESVSARPSQVSSEAIAALI